MSTSGPIELDYRIAPTSPERRGELDLGTASIDELHYRAFLGDVVFRVGGVDFSAAWGWVPVLDFALALHDVVSNLDDGCEEVFEFTESDAVIRCRRNGDGVAVTASYVDAAAVVPRDELEAALAAIRTRIVADVSAAHPEVARNPAFLEVTGSGRVRD